MNGTQGGPDVHYKAMFRLNILHKGVLSHLWRSAHLPNVHVCCYKLHAFEIKMIIIKVTGGDSLVRAQILTTKFCCINDSDHSANI